MPLFTFSTMASSRMMRSGRKAIGIKQQLVALPGSIGYFRSGGRAWSATATRRRWQQQAAGHATTPCVRARRGFAQRQMNLTHGNSRCRRDCQTRCSGLPTSTTVHAARLLLCRHKVPVGSISP
jgi:hypothetical protein